MILNVSVFISSKVGYKVRLEGIKGRDTHLLFCTTGILLRRLLVDRNLKGVTHVIVDEIHERGMNEGKNNCCPVGLIFGRKQLLIVIFDARFSANCSKGAPSSSTRTKTDSDECYPRCRAVCVLFW